MEYMRSFKTLCDMSVKIDLRKDLNDKLKSDLLELQTFTNACYFEHLLVDRYYNPGFFISSFSSNEEWQDLYWKEYWHNDILERKAYKNALLNGSSMIPWNLIDKVDDCMVNRKKTTEADNGVMMARKVSDTVMESISIGWKKGKNIHKFNELLNQTDGVFQKIQNTHFDVFRCRHEELFCKN